MDDLPGPDGNNARLTASVAGQAVCWSGAPTMFAAMLGML